MSDQQQPASRYNTEQGQVLREIQLRLDRLERREWWMWWAAVIVMLLLTTGIVSFAIPGLFNGSTPTFQFQLSQAVRGLVGLVLLFNTYTIYQHLLIKRLRRKLGEQVQRTTQLQTQAEEFYRLAVEDSLTGLHNRRFADERIATEVARSQRHGQPFTVVSLDLDDFKQINDLYGHSAGDTVLREFGERLRKAIRTSDMAARMGGDEFVVLMLECPPEHARHLINRLQPLEVELGGRKISLNISAGWTGYRIGDQPADLLDRADRDLYENKRTKNGISMGGSLEPTPAR